MHHACHTKWWPQVEIDFKAECKAGELIESLSMPLTEAAQQQVNQQLAHAASQGNGNGSSNGASGHAAPAAAAAPAGQVQYLHTLRRCDEAGCVELVRCRTTWA